MASISPICKKCKTFILALKCPTYRDFMIKKSLKSKTSKSHTWAPLKDSIQAACQRRRRLEAFLSLAVQKIYAVTCTGLFMPSLQRVCKGIQYIFVWPQNPLINRLNIYCRKCVTLCITLCHVLTRIPTGESIWGSRSKKDRLLKNQ